MGKSKHLEKNPKKYRENMHDSAILNSESSSSGAAVVITKSPCGPAVNHNWIPNYTLTQQNTKHVDILTFLKR